MPSDTAVTTGEVYKESTLFSKGISHLLPLLMDPLHSRFGRLVARCLMFVRTCDTVASIKVSWSTASTESSLLTGLIRLSVACLMMPVCCCGVRSGIFVYTAMQNFSHDTTFESSTACVCSANDARRLIGQRTRRMWPCAAACKTLWIFTSWHIWQDSARPPNLPKHWHSCLAVEAMCNTVMYCFACRLRSR